jgi:ribonuclease III
VTKSEVLEKAEVALGYKFADRAMLSTALTHASITDNRLRSNERLEFLGDAILSMVVCTDLFDRYPHYLEGEPTKVKSAVVSRQTCAKAAMRLGLPELLFLGKGMSGRSQIPSSLAAAVFESIIAAIYLDSGDLDRVRKFILDQIRDIIEEAVASEHQQNYKSQLQQFAQKGSGTTPFYDLLDEQGPDHSKCFEVCVVVSGRRFPSAWGPSKKEAEQKAAFLALQELGVLNDDDEPPGLVL